MLGKEGALIGGQDPLQDVSAAACRMFLKLTLGQMKPREGIHLRIGIPEGETT